MGGRGLVNAQTAQGKESLEMPRTLGQTYEATDPADGLRLVDVPNRDRSAGYCCRTNVMVEGSPTL